ncbi:hypothetical protein SAMN00790413_04273 [Deinococcus hopiensis KR-140]|uniref:Transcriptional regulator, TetR family n=1 Tax=Deinococcus hopiensis KR-140 TaxID=695939 RepID=A0A1W1UQ58_9DEIO|nr:hypothetical protein SAMN00790413_04273 [Deinococcus hopiensis KR-140]
MARTAQFLPKKTPCGSGAPKGASWCSVIPTRDHPLCVLPAQGWPESGHAQETPEKVLSAGPVIFRADGRSTAGIGRLLGKARFPHGGFYAHFVSKDALVQQFLVRSLRGTSNTLLRAAGHTPPYGLVGMVRNYVIRQHCGEAQAEGSCVLPPLAAEIARRFAVSSRLVRRAPRTCSGWSDNLICAAAHWWSAQRPVGVWPRPAGRPGLRSAGGRCSPRRHPRRTWCSTQSIFRIDF